MNLDSFGLFGFPEFMWTHLELLIPQGKRENLKKAKEKLETNATAVEPDLH